MSGVIPAVVLGSSGYVGGELLRLLAAHPQFRFAAAVSENHGNKPVAEVFPHLAGAYADTLFSAHADWLDGIDAGTDLALFSAAPHGASAELVARTLDATAKKNLNVHVVDSSADFRYANKEDYEAVYGTHGAPDLLSAFYSAVPEHAAGSAATHIGHPGCFATAVLLALVPLLQSGLTEAEFFVSATTGSTGSGRSPQAGTHHPERHGNLYAYKPLAHRHTPEIAAHSSAAAGRNTNIHFIPHSGPFARGIYATVQAKAATAVTTEKLKAVFETAYEDSPFVRLVDTTPRLKDVVASNYCQIGVATDGNTVAVMSAIDNLVKGAAGGAVQWMNRLWGLPDTTGLLGAAPGWA